MDNNSRMKAISYYKNNKRAILLACKALDEGLDIPDTHIGIIVASTEAIRQRIQRVGRILRKAPGKDYSWIFTIYAKDTTEEERYTFLSDNALFGIKNIDNLTFDSNFSI